MVFRRGSRPSWYFQARTRTGWEQLCAHTPDKRLGQKIEAMWEELAAEHRAWDLLEPVLSGDMRTAELYDLWVESQRKVEELRRRLRDTDLEPIVEEFLAVHGKKVKPDSLEHVRFHVRALIPADEDDVHHTFPRSHATPEYLTQQLYAYEGKRNTLRKVHSSWSVFFTYCTAVKRLFDRNPMELVARPSSERPPIRFYELDVVERIVEWQPTAERRAAFALLYGAAVEPSVALTLARSDVQEHVKSVRAPGTKTHTRDRVARIADWAWPVFWAHVSTLLPATRLFPLTWTRHTLNDFHAEAVEALELPHAYPMYNARHHWAVRQLRGGAPIKLVQEQLGHSSPNLTLEVYGQFRPTADERDQWEAKATAYETQRRAAGSGRSE